MNVYDLSERASLLRKTAAPKGSSKTDKLVSRIFGETLELMYVLYLRGKFLTAGKVKKSHDSYLRIGFFFFHCRCSRGVSDIY